MLRLSSQWEFCNTFPLKADIPKNNRQRQLSAKSGSGRVRTALILSLSRSLSYTAEPMQNMILRVIAASLIIAPSFTRSSAPAIFLQFIIAVPAGAEPREQIHALLAKHGIPGASIALIENGQIAWARGYRAKELQPPTRSARPRCFRRGPSASLSQRFAH